MKTKILVVLMLIIAMLMPVVMAEGETDVTVSLETPNTTVTVGDTFVVDVSMNIGDYNFNVWWAKDNDTGGVSTTWKIRNMTFQPAGLLSGSVCIDSIWWDYGENGTVYNASGYINNISGFITSPPANKEMILCKVSFKALTKGELNISINSFDVSNGYSGYGGNIFPPLEPINVTIFNIPYVNIIESIDDDDDTGDDDDDVTPPPPPPPDDDDDIILPPPTDDDDDVVVPPVNETDDDDDVIPPVDNIAPVAKAGMVQKAEVGETVTFDGSYSYDNDGEIVKYEWTFDDGTGAFDCKVTHNYTVVGLYEVNLMVTDNNGATSNETVFIQIVEKAVVEPEPEPKSAIPIIYVVGVIAAIVVAFVVVMWFKRRME